MSAMPECPHCLSIDTSRSHRRSAEYFMLGFRFFRCNHCQRRFHNFLLRNLWEKTAA